MALKTARDGKKKQQKNMKHDSVNIFFKLLFKNFFSVLHFGTNYSHRIVRMYFFYKLTKDRCSDQQRPPLTKGGLSVCHDLSV